MFAALVALSVTGLTPWLFDIQCPVHLNIHLMVHIPPFYLWFVCLNNPFPPAPPPSLPPLSFFIPLCAYVCVLSVLSDSVWDLTNHKTRTESREGSEAMRNTPPPLLHPQPLPPTTAALTPADAPTHTNCRICLTQRTHTHTNMHQTAGKRLQREAVAF